MFSLLPFNESVRRAVKCKRSTYAVARLLRLLMMNTTSSVALSFVGDSTTLQLVDDLDVDLRMLLNATRISCSYTHANFNIHMHACEETNDRVDYTAGEGLPERVYNRRLQAIRYHIETSWCASCEVLVRVVRIERWSSGIKLLHDDEIHWLLEHGQVVIVNSGAWYSDVVQLEQDISNESSMLSRLLSLSSAKGVRIVWRESFAQHFPTPTGQHNNNVSKHAACVACADGCDGQRWRLLAPDFVDRVADRLCTYLHC